MFAKRLPEEKFLVLSSQFELTQNPKLKTQNSFPPTPSPPPPPPAELHPPLLHLAVAENLAAVLRGEVDPPLTAASFPGADLSDLTQLYESSVGSQVMNSLVQRGGCGCNSSPLSGPIRILEIGAGTGGTTAHLLPHLQNI